MSVQKVMMVDDEEDIRTIGELSLTLVGQWRAITASGGAEALALAAAEQPDVILLDVMMPGIDGPTAHQLLKSQPSTSAIPVIFMTAKVQSHEVSRYLASGAAGVIPKPFDPLLLPQQVRALVESPR
jgi:CheY-like chemotaxis protein